MSQRRAEWANQRNAEWASVAPDPAAFGALADLRSFGLAGGNLVFDSGLVAITDPRITAMHEGYDDLVKVFAKPHASAAEVRRPGEPSGPLLKPLASSRALGLGAARRAIRRRPL
jgi:hypothetical protein